MAFEHYHRQGTKILRCGYTTGTCAVLAAETAARLLLQDVAPESVSCMTKKNVKVEIQPERYGTYITADRRRHA